MSDQVEYSINELARKANVTIRTVRFYINEGLLPAPETRGRYAVYAEEYLDRLELIRRLKDSFLPLKEIRATLSALGWKEVRETLDNLRKRETGDGEAQRAEETPPPAARAVREDRSSALGYISELLASPPEQRPLPPRLAAQPEPDLSLINIGRALETEQEAWQRVTLAPGVELHIRQPFKPRDQDKINQIIRLAKKLFST